MIKKGRLHLVVKKKFFDMIASGEKTEEYREIKPYYVSRFWNVKSVKGWDSNSFCRELIQCGNESELFNFIKQFDVVELRNGYGYYAPKIIIDFEGIYIGKAKPEWSDNWQGDVFVIKLGKIILNKKGKK